MTRLPEEIQLQVSRILFMGIWNIDEVMNEYYQKKKLKQEKWLVNLVLLRVKRARKPWSSPPTGTMKSFVAKEEKLTKVPRAHDIYFFNEKLESSSYSRSVLKIE